ncbi:uncharacterized protein STEHIDRAFT_44851, partial [Stereum hirsutum FP-91666 SS1]|uniref:uncharacterized protein n=1 Tax=Stereum hirsutum (strain FP-91666) TaxID=721885 RepID=UPI000440BB87
WLGFRSEYLDELMRSEGRGFSCGQTYCSRCQKVGTLYRCKDCSGGDMLCGGCIVNAHLLLPLHIVEEWTGQFFRRVRLAKLGLRIQLGHKPGEPCACPHPGNKDFIVLHINGIHQVAVDFCGCYQKVDHWRQLARYRWYPATPLNPQTCATFELLRLFQTMNLQGKITAYDFYHGLVRLTDGYGIEPLPDRLPSFMIMEQEWRNLLLLKRGGRGLDPSGVKGTKQGSLAVDCRACPIPEVNIPKAFEYAPKEEAWLYRLLLAQDANFRLKGRLRRTSVADISLTNGLAYFVEEKAYKAYLDTRKDKEDDLLSNCVPFNAISKANNKGAKSLANTGVGGVCCGRHECIRPNGIGDLQKGERYANMDYIFLASIIGIMLLALVSSYDIGCQWSINFWERMAEMPDHLQMADSIINILFVVPAFHLEAHIEKCKPLFSPRFSRWLALTEFEAIERIWAILNGAAFSTKEMRPGHRRDTLDDFCGYANWTKTIKLGSSLLKKLVVAIPACLDHRAALRGFEDNLRKESPAVFASWVKMYEDWEEGEDKSVGCPFVAPRQELTIGEVRLRLTQKEQERGVASIRGRDDSGECAFIVLGMDIEVQQAQLQADLKKARHATHLQRADLEDRRSSLHRRIQRLRDLQTHLMPDLRLKLDMTEQAFKGRRSDAETTPLHLPSSLPPNVRAATCSSYLIEAEQQLREAEAFDALESLRNQLRTRTFMSRYKISNITGQRTNTRAQEILTRVEGRLHLVKLRYRRARTAVMSLLGEQRWMENGMGAKLRELKDEDVRGLSDAVLKEADKASVSEKQIKMSWIWTTVSIQEDGSDPGFNDALRIEWAKAKARASRWTEEVQLVFEEMRRTIEYCRWRKGWWERQAGARKEVAPELADGLSVYALEHADLEDRMARNLTERWGVIRSR